MVWWSLRKLSSGDKCKIDEGVGELAQSGHAGVEAMLAFLRRAAARSLDLLRPAAGCSPADWLAEKPMEYALHRVTEELRRSGDLRVLDALQDLFSGPRTRKPRQPKERKSYFSEDQYGNRIVIYEDDSETEITRKMRGG